MKNIYAIFFSMLFISGAYAQTPIRMSNETLLTPRSITKPSLSQNRTTSQFIIDYDVADSISQTTLAGNLYDTRYRWMMNSHYELADSVISFNLLRHYIVVFDSLIDTQNQIGYSRNSLASVTLDTLYLVVGQENNSGLDDTIVVKVQNVLANRYPGNTILWDSTIVIPASSPISADWGDFFVLPVFVGYQFTPATQRFAVKVEYWGDKADTAGFISGFSYNGNCASGTEIAYPSLMTRTVYNPSAASFPAGFYANSYVYYNFLEGQYPATNNYLYFSCDAQAGYQAGSDAFNFWQNILMNAMVTIDDGVGIQEQAANGITLFQNSPNPFSNETTIHYSLQKGSKVTIEVTDLTGRVVAVMNEGYRNAGKFNTAFNAGNLSEGTYFYTLKTETSSLTNRMVIKR